MLLNVSVKQALNRFQIIVMTSFTIEDVYKDNFCRTPKTQG